jgi:hypothetical protein
MIMLARTRMLKKHFELLLEVEGKAIGCRAQVSQSGQASNQITTPLTVVALALLYHQLDQIHP